MKSIRALAALAVAASLVFAIAVGQTPATPPDAAPATGERLPPERFEVKVLKVYAAQDGEARFRAYIVRWKGQEVVASDSLARSDYKEGDVIAVLAMNHPYPQGKEPHRLLAFSVMPPPPSR